MIFYVSVTDGICVISIHSIYHDFIITLFPTHKHAPGFAEENDHTQAELFACNAISDERSGVTFHLHDMDIPFNLHVFMIGLDEFHISHIF